MSKVILALFLTLVTLPTKAGETNRFFLTDDGTLRIDRAHRIEEAKKSRESLPAEGFPEGNWGSVTNGIQLSMRFEKSEFRIGEPITAIILLRNVTDNIRKYRLSAMANSDGPIDFAVTESGRIVAPLSAELKEVVSSRIVALGSYTQNKFFERLDKRFDLSKEGKYEVYARFWIGEKKGFEVDSAKAIIEIKR